MLPTQGVAVAIFLLSHAARLGERCSVSNWLEAAQSRSSFLAAALDFHAPADLMLRLSLAHVDECVRIAPSMAALSHEADRRSLEAIARAVLVGVPPIWLWTAVEQGAVDREFIPSHDLEALSWLEPNLDAVLLSVHEQLSADREKDDLQAVGALAERILLAEFAGLGLNPVHVAPLFDGCGYDIELPGPPIRRIEVKAASSGTRGNFRITRNEFEKSRAYGEEWLLTQVVLQPSAFLADVVCRSAIIEVLELSAANLDQAVPSDTANFAWAESAQVSPRDDAWTSRPIALNHDFQIRGVERKRNSSVD